jgi:hypothetical protein
MPADQASRFGEAETLARATAPESVGIPVHGSARYGRRKPSAKSPRVGIVHDSCHAWSVPEKHERPPVDRRFERVPPCRATAGAIER